MRVEFQRRNNDWFSAWALLKDRSSSPVLSRAVLGRAEVSRAVLGRAAVSRAVLGRAAVSRAGLDRPIVSIV